MKVNDKVVVITGGAGGIGKALAAAFIREGARAVVLSDFDGPELREAALEIGCDSAACDVTDEKDVKKLIACVLSRYGHVDLFCSNAGSTSDQGRGLVEAENDAWLGQWNLNVMAHLYATRALLPSMIKRGHGYFLITSSAAGLLAALTAGPYTVTKAAAVKFAEMLSIGHGDEGIKVSVLCPQGVNTAMAPKTLGDGQSDGILEPEQVAQVVLAALDEERFHVLPHPEVEKYVRRKAEDIDRWIRGMRKLRGA